MATNYKATWSKRQREQDQKDRAAERIARRRERKARAAERVASGQVGPQIGEAAVPELDHLPALPADHSAAADPGTAVRSGLADVVPARPQRRRDPTGTRLYVGNLSSATGATAVRELFAKLGEVSDVHVVMDHVSGDPRGFAFVAMGTVAEAQRAIQELDGQIVDGRALRVKEAEQREAPRGGVNRSGGGRRF